MEAVEELLGKLLAKELGIHCYDRELLRMASEQSGINEALFGQVDGEGEVSSAVWYQ